MANNLSSLTREAARYARIISVLALLTMFGLEVGDAFQSYETIEGHEHLRIARNLANGEGFSFHASRRWLFEPGVGEGYRATAWLAPVYPATLSSFYFLLGEEHGNLAIMLVHALLFLGTGLAVYRLGSSLANNALAGPAALLIYVFLLLYQERNVPYLESVQQLLSNAPLGGFVVALSALLLLRLVEKPSFWRAAVSGFGLGLAALSYAGTIAFGPAAFIALIIGPDKRADLRRRLALGTVMVGFSALTILPWAARNFVEFGYWVPVRNGSGQIMHTGNVALAATFAPETVPLVDHVPPPWTASSLGDALNKAMNTGRRRALETWQFHYVQVRAPQEYAAMNEVERDKEHLRQVKEFALSHPILFLQMTVAKGWGFTFGRWLVPGVLAALALCGLLWRARDTRAQMMFFIAAAYALPYMLSIPFFYRYRYPIDPVLSAVAAGFLAGIATAFLDRLGNLMLQYRRPLRRDNS